MTRRVLLAALLLTAAPASAQQVRTAVLPGDITVGDVFHAVIRVSTAADVVTFPDSLILPADLESAGRRLLRRDTIGGEPGWSAVYPLTAWRTGEHALPPAEVRLADARAARAVFPTLHVRSVLPADTAGVEPKPAKDVLGADRVWWPLLLIIVLLLALAAAALIWYRRRQRRTVVPLPALALLPPRERALQALDSARTSGALEAGDYRRFYTDVSDAVRSYLAALDPTLGLDLTTSELLPRVRAAGRDRGLMDLRTVLHAADMVKFARRRPERQTALEEWQQARRWVEQLEPVAAPQERAA